MHVLIDRASDARFPISGCCHAGRQYTQCIMSLTESCGACTMCNVVCQRGDAAVSKLLRCNVADAWLKLLLALIAQTQHHFCMFERGSTYWPPELLYPGELVVSDGQFFHHWFEKHATVALRTGQLWSASRTSDGRCFLSKWSSLHLSVVTQRRVRTIFHFWMVNCCYIQEVMSTARLQTVLEVVYFKACIPQHKQGYQPEVNPQASHQNTRIISLYRARNHELQL
jgi:hypothetical protein